MDKGDGISAGEKANLVLEHFCPDCTVSEIECEIVRQNDRFFGLNVSAIDYDTFMLSGWGVGLSAAHNEILALGGTIEAQSQVNEGTTFKITLPYLDRHTIH